MREPNVHPDQPAHLCSLLRIYIIRYLIRNCLTNSDKITNRTDPDQTAHMCRLIWNYKSSGTKLIAHVLKLLSLIMGKHILACSATSTLK